MEIDINGVKITLTKEQLSEIARQTNKIKFFKDIRTLEDAYEVLGDIATRYRFLLVKMKELGVDEDTIAHTELKVIIKAVNLCEDGKLWVPDWDNTNEAKWHIWFNMLRGFSFVYASAGDYWDNANSIVGSHLCLKTKDRAEHMGTTFLPYYKRLLK